MALSKPLPPNLVAASAEDGLHSKLLDMRIKHPRVAGVIEELNSLIYPGAQDSILLVCGPSGVGKTTLARFMVESALHKQADAMAQNAGLVPAVYVEADSSGEHEFNWRLFYSTMLDELDGELDLPKHHYGVDPLTGEMYRPRKVRGNNLASLRTSLQNSLRARATRFLVIDEAAHIFEASSRTQLRIKLNTLKSLANKGHTQIVLVGSYDLYELVSLSGQLARRTHVVHFERYRQDQPEDVLAFRACLQKFQDALPDLWGKQLMAHADALHENCLGCVGMLSAVLTRAAKLALADGKWSLEHLRRGLYTKAQRKQILEEILEGERMIGPSLSRSMSEQGESTTSRRAA